MPDKQRQGTFKYIKTIGSIGRGDKSRLTFGVVETEYRDNVSRSAYVTKEFLTDNGDWRSSKGGFLIFEKEITEAAKLLVETGKGLHDEPTEPEEDDNVAF